MSISYVEKVTVTWKMFILIEDVFKT